MQFQTKQNPLSLILPHLPPPPLYVPIWFSIVHHYLCQFFHVHLHVGGKRIKWIGLKKVGY
jgi:hypothetical protein